MSDHQRMMLRSQLSHLDSLDTQIDELSQEVAERMAPLVEQINLLDEIPGVWRRIAEEVLAEVGLT